MAEVNNVSRITGTWTWNVDICHSGYLYYYIIEYLCTYEWGTMKRKRIRLKTCSRVIPSAFSRRQSYYKEADMKNCGLILKKIRKSTGCHSILPEARLSEGECTKRHYNLPLARQTEWERQRKKETESEKPRRRNTNGDGKRDGYEYQAMIPLPCWMLPPRCAGEDALNRRLVINSWREETNTLEEILVLGFRGSRLMVWLIVITVPAVNWNLAVN